MFVIVYQDSITDNFVNHISHRNISNMTYFQLDLKDNKNDTINILDLGATGRFQKRVTAKEFCEHLINSNMPENIKNDLVCQFARVCKA